MCVCLHDMCVDVCTGPLQKQVTAAQKRHSATDDGHYPINLLFLYTLCPLYVLFERTAGVCVCVCVREMDEVGGGRVAVLSHTQAHTYTHTHFHAHTHSAPVTNSLSEQEKRNFSHEGELREGELV